MYKSPQQAQSRLGCAALCRLKRERNRIPMRFCSDHHECIATHPSVHGGGEAGAPTSQGWETGIFFFCFFFFGFVFCFCVVFCVFFFLFVDLVVFLCFCFLFLTYRYGVVFVVQSRGSMLPATIPRSQPHFIVFSRGRNARKSANERRSNQGGNHPLR